MTSVCVLSMSKIGNQLFQLIFSASSCGNGGIKLWDIDSGVCVGNMVGHIAEIWALCPITSVALGEEEPFIKYLASGGADKSVRIWNYERLTCEMTFFGHFDMVRCLKSIDDLELIASGSADYKIKIWNLKTKKIVS